MGRLIFFLQITSLLNLDFIKKKILIFGALLILQFQKWFISFVKKKIKMVMLFFPAWKVKTRKFVLQRDFLKIT